MCWCRRVQGELQAALAARREAEARLAAVTPETELAGLKLALDEAGFKPLSELDLEMSEALNEGYLPGLSIMPELAGLDRLGAAKAVFEGRLLVYHRGYGVERSQGRLLLPKLNYLLAAILARLASPLAEPAAPRARRRCVRGTHCRPSVGRSAR